MLNALGRRAGERVRRSPHSDVIGLGRTLLALATLGTLLLNPTAVLFAPSVEAPAGPVCAGVRGLSMFCFAGRPEYLELVRWVGVAVLAVVASGWRPRFTALPHWWVTWSVASSITLTDGGDQVAATLTLLLLPIALTDARRWHWQPDGSADSLGTQRQRIVAYGFLWLLRLQVAGIYLHAAISKLGQPEWADGTALYYWLGNPVFGLPPWIRAVSDPVLQSGIGVTALTWGVIVLELSLAAGIMLEGHRRGPLLVAGLAFHLGIIGMGLLSFAMVMCAALLLFLRPADQPLHLPDRVGSLMASTRRSVPTMPSSRLRTPRAVTPHGLTRD